MCVVNVSFQMKRKDKKRQTHNQHHINFCDRRLYFIKLNKNVVQRIERTDVVCVCVVACRFHIYLFVNMHLKHIFVYNGDV